jgi:hypothetical protein
MEKESIEWDLFGIDWQFIGNRNIQEWELIGFPLRNQPWQAGKSRS